MSVKCVEEPAKQGEPWSEEDLQCVSDNYGLISTEEIADYLKRSTRSIWNAASRLPLKMADNSSAGKTAKLKPAKLGEPWSEEALQYLSDNYGLIPNEMIALHLRRSVTSIPLIANRKLHLNLTDNFYTASELARTLGLLNSNTIVGWVRNGWLKGQSNFCGKGKWLWCFVEEDIVECLRQRPWLVVVMPTRQWLISDYSHYFFYLIRDEWNLDPWYTTAQAASLLRVANRSVKKYIERGWLLVAQKPVGTLPFFIRRSIIEAFLANDPRPSYLHNARSKSSRSRLEKLGFPTRIETVWHFVCPRCGQEVRIAAPPSMMGAEIREKFITVYVNGACLHSATVKIGLP